jgi:hypothetical protein
MIALLCLVLTVLVSPARFAGYLGHKNIQYTVRYTSYPRPALKIFGETRSLAHAIFGACQTVKLSS